ncbi:leucyl aminopeptidase [Corynebacterium xerosis]|uniref:Probable cytosol aminopeptidase n=1 Tax=Corynebacterium xerosis TaxID=1725 RepID=A0A6B8TLC6_9CORY|nr:leucyl aminopeptidase [Corynebacterium xerosis]QGS33726.1 leucyl aminopeptidase [Corynebacterium xerosis]
MTDSRTNGFATPNSTVLGQLLPATGTRIDVVAGGDAAVADLGADCLLVALLDGDDLELVASSALGDKAAEVLTLLEAVGASAKLETVTRIPAPEGTGVATIAAVGLGDGDPDSETIRRASGAAARALGSVGHVVSALGELDAAAAAEGFGMGAYSYDGLRKNAADAGAGSSESKAGANPNDADSNGADSNDGGSNGTDSNGDEANGARTLTVLGATEEDAARAAAVIDAVATARDFVNTASSHLYPEVFADAAAKLGESAGVEVEVLDDEALAADGFGGLTAVGGGSARGPRLVRMTWAGGSGDGKAGNTAAADGGATPKVALVGKGVTFDTGGISLKPGANMENMISDMGGAAAVIATVVLAARLGLPVPVTATIPMAENMPGGRAYRPGDVITQYGGTTVEILNTDAEGRLILADALVRACEDEPTHLIDTATLTGAQLIALGGRTPGVLGTDEFRDRVSELSREVGEGGWSMPIPEELAEGLKSPVADLRNVSNSREGGMSVAAAYLREFVGDDVEWVHIDVAGPAFNTNAPWGYTPKRATGVPVRTMFAALEDLAGK